MNKKEYKARFIMAGCYSYCPRRLPKYFPFLESCHVRVGLRTSMTNSGRKTVKRKTGFRERYSHENQTRVASIIHVELETVSNTDLKVCRSLSVKHFTRARTRTRTAPFHVSFALLQAIFNFYGCF